LSEYSIVDRWVDLLGVLTTAAFVPVPLAVLVTAPVFGRSSVVIKSEVITPKTKLKHDSDATCGFDEIFVLFCRKLAGVMSYR
jgi:hypothetical protein